MHIEGLYVSIRVQKSPYLQEEIALYLIQTVAGGEKGSSDGHARTGRNPDPGRPAQTESGSWANVSFVPAPGVSR
jgi:hypothetical protein